MYVFVVTDHHESFNLEGVHGSIECYRQAECIQSTTYLHGPYNEYVFGWLRHKHKWDVSLNETHISKIPIFVVVFKQISGLIWNT